MLEGEHARPRWAQAPKSVGDFRSLCNKTSGAISRGLVEPPYLDSPFLYRNVWLALSRLLRFPLEIL